MYVAGAAIAALVKIGPQAMPELVEALQGNNPAIERAARRAESDSNKARAHAVRRMARGIGSLGHRDGVAPLLQELRKPGYDDVTQAVLALELGRCPLTEEALKAALDSLESIPPGATIPTRGEAKLALTDSLANSFSPSILPRIIRHFDKLQGEQAEELRPYALEPICRLMRWDQVVLVEGALRRWAPPSEFPSEANAFNLSKAVVIECRGNIACYLAKLRQRETQEKSRQVVGIKSAHMLGVLGTDKTRSDILQLMPLISNAAIRYTLGLSLDHLTPFGDVATADALESHLQNEKVGGYIHGKDMPLWELVYRLKARQSATSPPRP